MNTDTDTHCEACEADADWLVVIGLISRGQVNRLGPCTH
jgi:hypothetical protein